MSKKMKSTQKLPEKRGRKEVEANKKKKLRSWLHLDDEQADALKKVFKGRGLNFSKMIVNDYKLPS